MRALWIFIASCAVIAFGIASAIAGAIKCTPGDDGWCTVLVERLDGALRAVVITTEGKPRVETRLLVYPAQSINLELSKEEKEAPRFTCTNSRGFCSASFERPDGTLVVFRMRASGSPLPDYKITLPK